MAVLHRAPHPFLLSFCTFLATGFSAMAEEPRRITLTEALAVTLSHNPSIQLQKGKVKASEGSYRQGKGQFDLSIQSSVSGGATRTPYLNAAPIEPPAPSTTANPAANAIFAELYRIQLEEYRAAKLAYTENPVQISFRDSVEYSVGASQQSRLGPTLNPVISVQHSDLRSSAPSATTGTIKFNLDIPLLRGAGYQAVTANERAAKARMQATRETFTHTTAQQIYATVAAYWKALAAEKALTLARSNERRGEQLVEITEALIKGGAQPAAQLQAVKANYEAAGASRIAAEQSFTQAILGLATSMGLDPENLVAPPFPAAEFPRAQEPPSYSPEELQQLIRAALVARADARAAQKTVESADILVVGAKNGLLPQLDARVTMGFNGVAPGSQARQNYAAVTDNLAGLNVLGMVSLALPVANNVARGNYEQVLGLREQYAAASAQIRISVGSDTVAYALGAGRAWKELSKRMEATESYSIAVGNQLELFKMGSATLGDVVTTQQNLNQAEQNENQARANFFVTLATLRFSVGALWTDTGGGFTVRPEEISIAPKPLQPTDSPPEPRQNKR
jgi:outer membrane protein